MDLVSNAALAIAAASFVLALIHLRLCFQRRNCLLQILFVTAALGLTVYALLERAMRMGPTPAGHTELLRWSDVFVWIIIVSTAWFVHFYLQTGRRSLLWLLTILRTIALIGNFSASSDLSTRHVAWLDLGIPILWMIVGQLSLLIFAVYSLEISIAVWRDGDRRRAITIGGSLMVFAVSSLVIALSILWGLAPLPLISSPFFFVMIGAMGYEMSRGFQRTSELLYELTMSKAHLVENERQLKLSEGVANVGVWSKDIGHQRILASRKWRELFEFDPDARVTVNGFLKRIHPEDRDRIAAALKAAENGNGEYDTEYRVVLPSGRMRWIGSHGTVELVGKGSGKMRGASVDITRRKLAEQDAHDLSQKLMGAQERERARLARELHDGLGQSLALLSIQLEILGQRAGKTDIVKEGINGLTSQIQTLSSDVHRISHELHPAKLHQLGLEAALRGFCREITEANGVQVHFDAAGVPQKLPNDISLCLYRITQESLQNVIKHSGAANANVSLGIVGDEIRLTISDNGSGFVPEDVETKESLGLVSMKERIRGVDGVVTVESMPGAGTTIVARIPFPANGPA